MTRSRTVEVPIPDDLAERLRFLFLEFGGEFAEPIQAHWDQRGPPSTGYSFELVCGINGAARMGVHLFKIIQNGDDGHAMAAPDMLAQIMATCAFDASPDPQACANRLEWLANRALQLTDILRDGEREAVNLGGMEPEGQA